MSIVKVVHTDEANSIVAALNPDLTQQWSYTVTAGSANPRGVNIDDAGDVYFVIGNDGPAKLAGDGSSKLWGTFFSDFGYEVAVSSDGVFSDFGGVRRYDKSGNEQTTNFPITGSSSLESDGDGYIYTDDGNSEIQKVDVSTGTVQWTTAGGGDARSVSKGGGTLVASSLTGNSNIDQIDDADGSLNAGANFPINNSASTSDLYALDNGDFLAATNGGGLKMYDSAGNLLWELNTSTWYKSVVARNSENVGFALTGGGDIYKFDLSGNQLNTTSLWGTGVENSNEELAMQVTTATSRTFSGAIQDQNQQAITADTVELLDSNSNVLDSQSNVSSYSLSASLSDGDTVTIKVTDAAYKTTSISQTTSQGTSSYSNDITLALPDVTGVTKDTSSDTSVTMGWSNNTNWPTDAKLLDTDTTYQVSDVDTNNNTIDVYDVDLSGDADFAVGETIYIDGSTGNDGTYTIASVTTGDYDNQADGTDTRITVNEDLTNATADGTIYTDLVAEEPDLDAGTSQVQFTGLVASTNYDIQLRYTTQHDGVID